MSELNTTNGTAGFSLCFFCNNSTNGLEKRLFATLQPKGPFFPVLADLQGKGKKLDALGRAVVCVACFHHLLRQWSSYERRGIPIRKREYSIIAEDRIVRYQTRREEDIRREAEVKIKEIQDREKKIQKEAEKRFDDYQKRRAEIKREAEKHLLQEQRTLSEFERDSSYKLREERHREEELRRQTEDRIQEEKEKREDIRLEAERLLREEKVVEAKESSSAPQSSNSQIVSTFRTEVILQAPVVKTKEKSRQSDSLLKAVSVPTETEDENMESLFDDRERQARTRRKKMMVYDPETGCYRKANQGDDDIENAFQETKPLERVEYRVRLRSDEKPRKTTEGNGASSRPDKESHNITASVEPNQYTSGEGRGVHTTEQTITLKDKRRSESAKDEYAGGGGQPESTEIMIAGIDDDGSKYRSSRFGRSGDLSARQEESLEDLIKEMEKRRERLLLRGPSAGYVQQTKGPEKEAAEAVDQSPEPVNPSEEATSPVDDTKKKQRSRQERNKRRLTAEELSIRKSLGSEEDLFIPTSKPADSKVLKMEKEEPKKNHQETPSQPALMTIGFDDEVFVTKEDPVEASADLMTWGDAPDGPDTSSSKEALAAERTQRTENSEPLPKEFHDPESREQEENSEPTVDLEVPIPVARENAVESEAASTGFLVDDEASTMAVEPNTELFSVWDKSRSDTDKERRMREKEHEERKRRIEENQRRAAQGLHAKKQTEEEVRLMDKGNGDRWEIDGLSMREKRRSLIDLWESFSETQPHVISFGEGGTDEPAEQVVNVSEEEKRVTPIDPVQEDSTQRDMDVDERENVNSRTSTLFAFDGNHKLSDDERKWESAGHFQPGRLQKTMFHNVAETEQQAAVNPRKGSRYDWMKAETTADQKALVPTKLSLDWSDKQSTAELKPSCVEVTESAPERSPWADTVENGKRESDSDASSEEGRVPRVDVDELHKMTEDERQWESAGHFQPKKLNTALLAGFQQGPSQEEQKVISKKDKPSPYDMLKKMHETTSQKELLVPTKLTVKTEETVEIRPFKELQTETEPWGVHIGSSIQDWKDESDSDDGVPEWKKIEERRRRQEQEEIERERQAEKKRQETGPVCDEEDDNETSPIDDEFEAKVRTKEVRRINPELLGQFMKQSDIKDGLHQVKAPSRETVESTKPVTASDEDTFLGDGQRNVADEGDDEFERKIKSKQVKKLALEKSPFLQNTTDVEVPIVQKRSTAKRSPQESNKDSRAVIIQEDEFVARIADAVVESQPVFNSLSTDDDDDIYELKIKSKDVKRLNKDQFDFLQRQEEEARRKREEEEGARGERDKQELLKRDEERRRRLEAEAEAKEERRIRLEEQRRQQQAEERARREEEQRLRLEEVERRRQEEEERLRREEEMERLAREEMRRQKEAAQKKFQSGVFEDDDVAQRKPDKDIASVGRLDSSMLVTFQKRSSKDSGPNVKTRTKAQKTKEEKRVPQLESETVVTRSVDLIESSPYDNFVEEGRREELEYEEKRKSVGRIDPAWYLKQQELQAAENERRARELEAERIREEQNEIVNMKRQRQPQEYDSEAQPPDNDDSEKRRGKISVDKLHQFQRETKEAEKISDLRKSQEQLITIESRSESAPLEFEEVNHKEKRKSKGYENGNFIILGRDSAPEAQRTLRLQMEREEKDMKDEGKKQSEEEQRVTALEEFEDESTEKPKNVGKLNSLQLSVFQQERQDNAKVLQRKRAPETERKVQEVAVVQRQEDVDSASNKTGRGEDYDRGPSMTAEEIEYEQSIKSAKALDVDKFLKSRSQEAVEREQRKRQLVEDRKRQEKEEMLMLRSEEQRRMLGHGEDLPDGDDIHRSHHLVDSSQNRSESRSSVETDCSKGSIGSSLSTEAHATPESDVDKGDKRRSVGRLPIDVRSTFESKDVTGVAGSSRPPQRTKPAPSKYVIERSECSSSRQPPSAAHGVDINGNVSLEGKKSQNWESSRREAGDDAYYRDDVIESSGPEEKPVPKRLDSSLFAAFERSAREPAAPLRRAKSEKSLRPKSVGNVDLGIWQDDSGLVQSAPSNRQREKSGHQPRPKSIAI